MNHLDLRTFLAVAEQRSFSRAAEALHVTQPAITKRVQRLEASLGLSLFDRVGKQVHLTAAGQLLQPRAQDLVHRFTDVERALHNLKRQVTGTLALCTSHHVGLHRLSPVLKAFSQTYPDVQLDIRFEDSEAAHDLVRGAHSELAIVTLDPNGAPDLEYAPLWDDPLCFVVAADHPLAQARLLTLSQLADGAVILPGLATYTGRIVVELFSAQGLELRPSMATNYLETIGMLVQAGLGWSVLPASMITEGLVRLAVQAPDLHRTLGCVTHPQRTLSNAASAFRDVLAQFQD